MNFMVESHVLQKLKPAIHDFITLIKESIEAKQPIYLRHHADADGYAAGIALERALVPLISAKQRRERDVFLYYHRMPLLTPHYSYEDGTRDIQLFLRNKEQFGTKAPFIVLLDVGSDAESFIAIQKVKIYGAIVAVIDHHPPEHHVTTAVVSHINPHIIGSSNDYSAGMLSSEIAHLLVSGLNDIPPQHFYFIAAVAGTADKVVNDEHKKYLAMCSHHGFSNDIVQRTAACLDYEAHILGPSPGKDIVQDILGRDEKKQQKLLALTDKQLHASFNAQLASCLKYSEIIEKKGFVFVKIPVDMLLHKNAYPTRGKTAGIVLEDFKNQGKKALVVAFSPTMLTFRCSREIKDFDIQEIITQIKKRYPYAQLKGGGHRVAGSISFISAAYSEILDFVEKYVDEIDKE